MNPEKAKAKEIAALFEVTPQAVGNWARRDGCPRNKDGTFSARDVIRWFIDKESGALSGGRSEALERYREARAAQERLRLEQMRGELVSQSEITGWMMDRVLETRTALQSVGQGMAASLVGQDAATIRELIDNRLRQICDDFARNWEKALEDEDESSKADNEGKKIRPTALA